MDNLEQERRRLAQTVQDYEDALADSQRKMKAIIRRMEDDFA
jgi:uncharacterized protein YlxW (UPF0749 family)